MTLVASGRIYVEFDCPWCSEPQRKLVYKSAETEVLCVRCARTVGLVTDEQGKPTRIGTKAHVEELMRTQNEQRSSRTRTHFYRSNNPSISIGSVTS